MRIELAKFQMGEKDPFVQKKRLPTVCCSQEKTAGTL
jgi:hypothetical protein